ncbi:unnamed protein product [Caenorhabditis bovis]|uniref:Nucleoporin NDC1 n=1 Tax=Caenorhabditis bovis TaxID=2654633 RepID=A0A8S1EC29_9PELO|nr:unnamed protein product [Caenorhabditis bovis]
MIGDGPSTSIFNEQPLFNRASPARQKVDDPVFLSSRLSTPNVIPVAQRAISSPKSTQKIVTIFDHILQWFSEEISTRKRKAAGVCAIFAIITYIATVSMLILSLWAPFSSLQEATTWFFSPYNWTFILLHASITFVVSLTVISYLCKIDQSPRIPLTDWTVWLIVGFEAVARIIAIFSIFYVSRSRFLEGFSPVVIGFGTFISSALVCFKNDFNLTFMSVYVNSVKTLIDLLKSTNYSNLVEICGIDAAIAYTSSLSFLIIFGPIFSGFHSWWLLVNIPFHFSLAVLYFSHQFYYKTFMKIVNQVVMKPFKFSFPPPYAIHSPTPEQIRTITNILEVEDPFLKIFAFYDLREIAWSDQERRRFVFSLSQPGGHARNWKSVSSACVHILDDMCSKMTSSSAKLVGYSWGDHNDEDEMPKEAIMMPRKMREMNYAGAHRSMHAIRAMNTQNNSIINKYLGKLFTQPKLIVSRYEAQITSYAAEAVYMLAITSLCEDRFGVVQKDLKDLITLLCKLIASIDTYQRARASVADKTDITYLKIVLISLQGSLQRVISAFAVHLKSLNLPEEAKRTIRLVCEIDEL